MASTHSQNLKMRKDLIPLPPNLIAMLNFPQIASLGEPLTDVKDDSSKQKTAVLGLLNKRIPKRNNQVSEIIQSLALLSLHGTHRNLMSIISYAT